MPHLEIAAIRKTATNPARGARRFPKLAVLGLAGISACSGPSAAPEPVAELTQALNACEETVPANRFIDGLPAYAQCGSTMNSAIWSHNGIDTATTSQGTGWVRTQRSGGYQCTEWAWRYMHFRWAVDYQNGNAGSWCDGNLPATLTKATTPVHGDLIVFAPGVCGSDGTTGHIAVIDTVNASAGTVTFVEENNAGRRSAKSTCAACFLHAVANDGSSNAGAGGGSGSGLGGAVTSGGSATSAGAANGGRSATGGFSAGGALAGSGPTVAGGPAAGGFPGAAGAASGGVFATTGGTNAGMSGSPASGGSAFTGGATATGGVTTSPTSSGGALAAGASSSVATSGGAPGASGSPAQPNAGTPGTPLDPISDINSGCSVHPGAPRAVATGWLGQFALALAGFTLRRRVRRRRG